MGDDELLDITAVCALLGGSRPVHPATVWRAVKAGIYPKPLKISPNTCRWRRSELIAAIERRIAERDERAA
jgi:predicted DNA-binding transcriptional regulator AlpA